MHKLKELYLKNNENRIFVTCHNRILADTLKTRIPQFFNFMKVQQQIPWDTSFWCTNAWGSNNSTNSGLYRYICNFYNIPFYTYSYINTFDSVCTKAITEIQAIKDKEGDSFKYALDFIIVDESQDFVDSFFDLCQLVTSQQVYIAGDIFQSIFSEHDGHDYQADYFLTRCYRTDPRNLMFAQGLGLGLFEEEPLRWLGEDDWKACGYQYRENEENIILSREPVRRFIDVEDNYESLKMIGFEDNFYELLYKELQLLIKDFPNILPDDICIILLDSDQTIYSMANNLESLFETKFNWQVNKAYETKYKIPNTVLISNRNNVKGLEYPFVFCISKKISYNYVYRNALYTMLTRSFIKSFLFLPSHGSGITEGIIKGFQEIMTKRQMTIRIPSEGEKTEIELRFQAAKHRKPLAEFISETVIQLGLPKEKRASVSNAALNLASSWEGCSDEEIIDKIKKLAYLA